MRHDQPLCSDIHARGESRLRTQHLARPRGAVRGVLVFATTARVEFVPIDVMERVAIDAADIAAIRAAVTPCHAAMADQTVAYHRFHARGQR